MFDEFDAPYNEAFSRSADPAQQRPLRLRKTITQKMIFWGTNCLVMPFTAVCFLTISSEGLRQLMAIFSKRIYSLPIPGAGLLQKFDGWNRLDLSHVMSLLLFTTITYVWYRILAALMDSDDFNDYRKKNPILFFLLGTIIGVLILGDCAIFYFGLESKASGGWGNTPEYVPILATILYTALLAAIGAWHADYHQSGTV